MRFHLDTRLDPVACAAAIAKTIPPLGWRPAEPKVKAWTFGLADGQGLWLRRRSRGSVAVWRPVLRAAWASHDDGTRIVGLVGFLPLVWSFLAGWTLIGLLMVACFLAAAAVPADHQPTMIRIGLFGVAQLIVGWGLAGLAWWWNRADEKVLLLTLMEATRATLVGGRLG